MTRISLMRSANRLFEAYPGLAFVVYGGLSLALILGFFSNLSTYLSFPASPTSATIESATSLASRKPAWVTLTGMRFLCDQSLPQENDRELIPLVEVAQDSLVLFDPPYDDHQSCQELKSNPAQGVIQRIPKRYFEYLSGLDFPILEKYSPAQTWVLCGDCGPSDSRLGMFLCAMFLPAPLYGFYHFFLRSKGKGKRLKFS